MDTYRGHEYRAYAHADGFSWCVYGNSNLHPIQNGDATPVRSRTMAEEAAMHWIDQKKRAERAT